MFIISDANESLQRSLDVIRANPIPVALIGLGTAWLIANNTGMTDRVADTASDMGRRVADTASDMSRRAGDLATGAAQRVGYRRAPAIAPSGIPATRWWTGPASTAKAGCTR